MLKEKLHLFRNYEDDGEEISDLDEDMDLEEEEEEEIKEGTEETEKTEETEEEWDKNIE